MLTLKTGRSAAGRYRGRSGPGRRAGKAGQRRGGGAVLKKQKEKKPRQPMTKQRRRELVIWLAAVAVFLIASILVGPPGRSETVQETMRDAVLHETNRVSLFGIKDVNPGLISAMLVSAFLLVAAALIRIFAIPRFKMIPGKFQLLLEQLVSLFDGWPGAAARAATASSGAYIFAAGVYIFTGTLSELIGVQVMATNGHAVTLPRAAVGRERGHRARVSVVPDHSLRRHRRRRGQGCRPRRSRSSRSRSR